MCREDFYQSKAWKRKRGWILRRDGYQCQDCKRYGRMRQATIVHHIKHLDQHPELALTSSNLVSLPATTSGIRRRVDAGSDLLPPTMTRQNCL
ncbi:MAG: HNH endonuclease [Oscillospiraceae bacterium]|nr:HNH endonuclease [Oscillospiraceae bacterium]